MPDTPPDRLPPSQDHTAEGLPPQPPLYAGGPSVHPHAGVTACRLGRWTEVGPRCRLKEVTMGDWSYVGPDAELAFADIGRFCSLAAAVRINPGDHPMDRATQHHLTYRAQRYGLGEADPRVDAGRHARAVTIGHDVWIGHGAIVLSGRNIGTGAVVGAGAVVTRDIPPYAIVVGNPARIVRRRFPEAISGALLRLAWWHWDDATIEARLPDLRDLTAEAFVKRWADDAVAPSG